jgi:UDPglucose 6-dehydrogenase
MKIGFVGMTHLGICHAFATVKKGFDIICFDNDSSTISNLKKGIINFYEPNLNKILHENKKKIVFTNDIKKLNTCDLVFLSEDVQTDDKNKSLYNKINILINKIIKNLNKKIIFVILSQVNVGFTEKIKWNKRKLYYQVETLIFGEALNRALYPQQFIIGAAQTKLESKYLQYLKEFKCPISVMNYQTAELAKISINLYLISSLSFTNSLAELCEKKKIDWSKIKSILHKDRRIGKFAYLNPGLGVLSGNLQRDLQSYKKILSENKCNLKVPISWEQNSDLRKKWVANLLTTKLKSFLKLRIGLYGLTYKKNITILKNSPAIDLLNTFKKTNFNIYDPKVSVEFKSKKIITYKDVKIFFKSTDLLVVLTDWDEIKNYRYNVLNNYKGQFIIDPYNTINNIKFLKNKKIFTLGKKLDAIF